MEAFGCRILYMTGCIKIYRIGVACYEKEMKNSIDKWSKIKYFIIKEYMTIYNNTSCMKSI